MKRTGRQKDIVTPEKKQEQRELLRLFSANIRKILKNTDLLADDFLLHAEQKFGCDFWEVKALLCFL